MQHMPKTQMADTRKATEYCDSPFDAYFRLLTYFHCFLQCYTK